MQILAFIAGRDDSVGSQNRERSDRDALLGHPKNRQVISATRQSWSFIANRQDRSSTCTTD
jgi:hypothetical protein